VCGHRSPSQHLSRSDPCRPYRRIGVRPFINCCGTRTIHSGTLVLPEVRRAMDAASRFFVNIDELMEAVGRRVADLTGAGHAIVTSGAAAALTHATAGCVTGGDPEKALRLPDVRGMKDRVVMIGGGRFTYDHAIRAVGARVVEVGSAAELERALDGRAAMIALLGTHLPGSPVSLETAAALAGARGVPIVVDAASEHLMRPDPYLAAGASLVCYSGGKYLRGPQIPGLLLGEERWVRAAWLNAAPHHALGRGMKVGKEEVMGLLAAVERWAAHCDPEADRRRWEADLRRIADAVGLIPLSTQPTREGE